jgi:hypothetical protein
MTLQREEAPREPGDMLGRMPAWPVQWPMIAMTSWWDAVFDAWQPSCYPHHAEECHDLAVPDPIEREGERALFA